MKYFTSGAAIVLILCTTACASDSASSRHAASGGDASAGEKHAFRTPPMDPSRRISEHDCRYAFVSDGGNLRCL